jgi:hypothetical protein
MPPITVFFQYRPAYYPIDDNSMVFHLAIIDPRIDETEIYEKNNIIYELTVYYYRKIGYPP